MCECEYRRRGLVGVLVFLEGRVEWRGEAAQTLSDQAGVHG